MSFLSWILLGLVAGFIGRKIVTKRGDGPLLHIVLSIVGAIAGGWLLSLPRGPRRPLKTSRAGASIRSDDNVADAVAAHRKKPLPPESSNAA
jgi:uncharacterized membrane protein YeaQ/YmgE (transglycosylase-associated protein family)